MEKLAAVFRARDTKTGQIKYGSTWIKKESDAIMRARGALSVGEELQAVWWIDWRDAKNPYNLTIMGVRPRDDKPEVDVAASLRTFHLKAKGSPTKPRWKRRGNQWISVNTNPIHPNVVQLVQQAIDKADETYTPKPKAKLYKPPYKVWYAEENPAATTEETE